MAIKGTVTLEDTTIQFHIDSENIAHYTVRDSFTHKQESLTAPMYKFMKALAIAVHIDGMPDYKADYPDAESIQGKIRWIP